MFISGLFSSNRKAFLKPSKGFLKKISFEVTDYFGKNYSNLVVCFQQKHWFVKFKNSNLTERLFSNLTSLLAKNWLNIPEIYFLNPEELFELRGIVKNNLDKRADVDNTYLVRLVQDYEKQELPIQNLDQAMASEIVFSSWIGRRDAHAFNRAFVSGIPMFFDFGIAYGEDKGEFFRPGPDPGYVPNWRSFNLASKNPDLTYLRQLERERLQALIPISNREEFDRAVKVNIERIKKISREDLYKHTLQAGFSAEQGDEIADYLNGRSLELEKIVAEIIDILDS
jgi:hypothetical protein